MGYPILESFSSPPSSSFAAFDVGSGLAPLQTPGPGYIDLYTPNGTTALWRILEAAPSNSFEFEFDVELITDTFGQKHYGIWLTTNDPGSSQYRGFRFSSYVPYNIDVRDYSVAGNTERTQINSPPIPTTGIVTWKIIAQRLGIRWHYQVWVGGVLFFNQSHLSAYGELDALMPAIFLYGCTIRVYEVRASLYIGQTLNARSFTSAILRRELGGSTGAVNVAGIKPIWGTKDIYFSGQAEVAGVVTANGIIAQRRVRLHERATGLVIREQWSDGGGNYSFKNLDADREYYAVSFDHPEVYNMVGKDRIRFKQGGDPYFSNVSLLLHGMTLADNSSTPKTFTAQGDAAVSTTEFKFAPSSLKFDGNGDWIETTSNLQDFVFGTGDFTIEFFTKFTTGNKVILDFHQGGQQGWQIYIPAATVEFFTTSAVKTGGIVVNDGQWHHIVVQRKTGALYFFIDGAQDGAAVPFTTNLNYQATKFSIGGQVNSRNATYDFNGYVDEVRITKGVARYDGSFTPPTSPFLDS